MTTALLFGDVVDDVIVIPDGRIRTDTDTDAQIVRNPGGSAANTAAWMATAGVRTTFLGRVGVADVARHTEALAVHGVDARLEGDAQHGTGTIIVLVDGERRTMLTDRGANALVDPDAIADALLAVDVVHVTGYSLLGGRADAVARLVRRAHAAGALVSCTIGSAGSIDDLGVEVALDALAGVDILVANLDEGALVTGMGGAATVSEALSTLAPITALTLGPAGVVLSERGQRRFVSPVASRLVDPTGAGDAFTATFVAGIASGLAPYAAAERGVQVAADAVTVPGARPPLPAG
jgi:sugar/nucleoside kinase (ribokinase family)